jgi:hypothetical protein
MLATRRLTGLQTPSLEAMHTVHWVTELTLQQFEQQNVFKDYFHRSNTVLYSAHHNARRPFRP